MAVVCNCGRVSIEAIVVTFTVSAGVHAVGGHVYAAVCRRNHVLVFGGHVVPLAMAVAMGSAWLADRVGQWLLLWGLGMFALGAVGALHAMATLFVAMDRKAWAWLPLTLFGTLVSAIGWLATFAMFATNVP